MPQPSHLSPEPFFFAGGAVGVLLIHGFTGAPTEMRPMGQYLAQRGLTVNGIQLPGHGTTPEDLAQVTSGEWIEACSVALADLSKQCDQVFVGGLSLGSLLTLWLGAHHPELSGLIVLAPAIKVRDWRIYLAPVGKYVVGYIGVNQQETNDLCAPDALSRVWCYDTYPVAAAAEVLRLQRRVRRLLPRATQPTLIVQGRNDAALTPDAAQIAYDRIGSTDKSLLWLERSGHNVLVDGERETLWERSYEWIRARAGQHLLPEPI